MASDETIKRSNRWKQEPSEKHEMLVEQMCTDISEKSKVGVFL